MATLMKSTQPHWLGNKFVPAGTVLPAGHPEAVDAFYEPFDVEDTPAAPEPPAPAPSEDPPEPPAPRGRGKAKPDS